MPFFEHLMYDIKKGAHIFSGEPAPDMCIENSLISDTDMSGVGVTFSPNTNCHCQCISDSGRRDGVRKYTLYPRCSL